jgi:hypothetical protein
MRLSRPPTSVEARRASTDEGRLRFSQVVLGWLLGLAVLCGFLRLEERGTRVVQWATEPPPLRSRATRAVALGK